MKLSVILTIYNEEKGIGRLLKSLLDQNIKPDEIVIVDGGSTDKTYNLVKRFAKKNKLIKIFQKKGANIAEGRNFAIKKAKNKIIVGADAGTKYDLNWLKNLCEEFISKEADLGFGKTLPLIENEFQKVLAKKMKQKFGSSRNIIFKKELWQKMGGYPEDLHMAEDTTFNEKIKRSGAKIIKIPRAIGYWDMRKDMQSLKKQFYNYGYWDGIAYSKYHLLPIRHKIAIFALTLLYPLCPIFKIIARMSLAWKIDVNRREAYLKGFWKGFLKK